MSSRNTIFPPLCRKCRRTPSRGHGRSPVCGHLGSLALCPRCPLGCSSLPPLPCLEEPAHFPGRPPLPWKGCLSRVSLPWWLTSGRPVLSPGAGASGGRGVCAQPRTSRLPGSQALSGTESLLKCVPESARRPSPAEGQAAGQQDARPSACPPLQGPRSACMPGPRPAQRPAGAVLERVLSAQCHGPRRLSTIRHRTGLHAGGCTGPISCATWPWLPWGRRPEEGHLLGLSGRLRVEGLK